jgi:hypothetical protein
MNRTYDIFRILPDFGPLWVDAVVGLEQARKRLNDLAGVESAKNLIYDSHMATFIKPHPAGLAVHAAGIGDSL